LALIFVNSLGELNSFDLHQCKAAGNSQNGYAISPGMKGAWDMLDKLRSIFYAGVNLVGHGRSSRFTCGDCDRKEQCGLPPQDDCVFRLTQIARDGGRPPRPYDYEYLYPAVWPHTGVRNEIRGN